MPGTDTQTCRQRVLDAVAGREMNALPYDLSGNCAHPVLYRALADHFAVSHEDNEALLQALGAHVRWGVTPYIGPPLEEAPPGKFKMDLGFKIVRGIWGTWEIESHTDEVERPLSGIETIQEVEQYPWPDPGWFDYNSLGWETYLNRQYLSRDEWLDRHKDYALVVGPAWFPLFSRIMDLVGMEHGLFLSLARPDLIQAMAERIGHFLEEYYSRLCSACRGKADFVRFADDFASQRGIMIGPDRWRELFLPIWKRLFAIARQNDLLPWLHSCGSVRAVLPDLIDAGLAVHETVQVHAEGMNPEELKREFGKDLTFYGGIDTQRILPHGTPEDVRREVRRLGSTLGRGGGYILTSAHTLMDDVPLANALAMFDEARNFGLGVGQ